MNLEPSYGKLALCLTSLAVLTAPLAWAQSTPEAGAAPQSATPPSGSASPTIQLAAQAPPPPQPVARTDKTHDGFYLRTNLGFGSQSTDIDTGQLVDNFSGSGGTLDFDVLVGGAPSPGIVLGGALLLESLPSTTFKADPYSLKTNVGLATLGPFIDGYPNPRGGFHLGGTIGVSSARLSSNAQNLTFSKAFGFGLAAWLGYDWWVADQWSIGGLLQFSGNRMTHHEHSLDMSVDSRTIALLLTAVYQ